MHPDGNGSQRRFVVCGDNPLAYRLVDELVTKYDSHVTVILPSVRENWAPKICAVPSVEIVESDRLDAGAFTRAGLANASAVAIVDQEDAGNVDAALIAQETNPDIRIVIRMFNIRLGERLSDLLPNVAVLSAAAIAAPAFVAAAIDDATTPTMRVAGRTVVATPRANAHPEDVICGLAITAGREDPVKLPAPEQEAQTDLVLAATKPAPPSRPRRRRRAITALSVVMQARLRVILLVLIAVLASGTAVLAWARDISLAQAAYLAILTELGSADANPAASGLERVTLVVLSLVSVALIPALTATIVDSVVKARLRLERGALVEPVFDHVVVVGLGDVGTRVVRTLHEEGLDVVAVERDSGARGVPIVRELGIPLIIGDASRAEVLEAASVATCRTLLIVSTDDVTNLETALLGRTAKPDMRVVVRLFDGDFADRVQRAFAINASRSVSYLAAPAFAAAMLGRQVIATIPVLRRVLLVAELSVGAGSVLEHRPLSAVNRTHEVRVLAVRSGDLVLWRPSDGRPLRSTDRLVVVATRAGLSQLLADTTPGETNVDAPYRLLEPWQNPRTRADLPLPEPAEGANGHPPFGPEDEGSTQPA